MFRKNVGLATLMVLGSVISVFAETVLAQRFTFARPPAPESTVDPKDRLSVTIDRWSSDAERDRLLSVIAENGQTKLLDAFRDVSRIGTFHWPGGLEYAIRYARKTARPGGGADIVLVVDRPLWVWWDAKTPSTDYPFSVVQIQIDKNGKGEGRVSFGVPVNSDKAAGVVLADFSKAPALLLDVREERD